MTRILVDTSVWIDHLHRADPNLAALLEAGLVITHPTVIGEVALGSIRDRVRILGLLANLQRLPAATDAEVLTLVEAHALYGRGLSLVDAHLLAASVVASDVRVWTRDRRFAEVADTFRMRWDAAI